MLKFDLCLAKSLHSHVFQLHQANNSPILVTHQFSLPVLKVKQVKLVKLVKPPKMPCFDDVLPTMLLVAGWHLPGRTSTQAAHLACGWPHSMAARLASRIAGAGIPTLHLLPNLIHIYIDIYTYNMYIYIYTYIMYIYIYILYIYYVNAGMYSYKYATIYVYKIYIMYCSDGSSSLPFNPAGVMYRISRELELWIYPHLGVIVYQPLAPSGNPHRWYLDTPSSCSQKISEKCYDWWIYS